MSNYLAYSSIVRQSFNNHLKERETAMPTEPLPFVNVRLRLQQLRDYAEKACIQASGEGNRDHSELWDKVYTALADTEKAIRNDLFKIDRTRGLHLPSMFESA